MSNYRCPDCGRVATGEPCELCGNREKQCVWFADKFGNWSTGCGNMWVLIEGKPTENKMRFCPMCGLRLKEGGMQ